MNALDSNESSCWNSDGMADGNNDISFIISFHRIVIMKEIRVQFQGGFVAEDCTLKVAKNTVSSASKSDDVEVEWKELSDTLLEAEDSNEIQSFDLTEEEKEEDRKGESVMICFKSSTDFYGRVTIYKLEVWGEET